MIKHYYLFSDIYDEAIKDFVLFCEKAQKGDDIIIHITSYGGDAFAAVAALNAIQRLRSLGVLFKADVMGMCASAATMIALSCDSIDMRENAVMMYHSAFGPDKEIVNKINTIQADLLKKRGCTNEYINELLSENPSYLSASEARTVGLCDNIVQSGVDEMKSIQIAAYVQKNRRFSMENENEWKEKKEEEVLGEDEKEVKCEGEGVDVVSLVESLTDAVKRLEERINRLESRDDDRDDEIEKKIDDVVEARARKVSAKIMSICAAAPKKVHAEKADAKADLERSKKLYGSVKLPD